MVLLRDARRGMFLLMGCIPTCYLGHLFCCLVGLGLRALLFGLCCDRLYVGRVCRQCAMSILSGLWLADDLYCTRICQPRVHTNHLTFAKASVLVSSNPKAWDTIRFTNIHHILLTELVKWRMSFVCSWPHRTLNLPVTSRGL